MYLLESLDVTQARAYVNDLGLAASYSPDCAEDEDGAALDHRLTRLSSLETIYAPPSGFTHAIARLIQNIAALRQLSDFDLPHFGWCNLLTRFRCSTALGVLWVSSLVCLSLTITTVM